MNILKERKLYILIDSISLVLSTIGVIVFTLIFKLNSSDIRYIFLLGDVVMFILFSSCLKDLEKDLYKPVVKYSKANVESKYKDRVKAKRKSNRKVLG